MGKTIAIICARGGSRGLPRKNVLPFHGKPLIVHTIEQALKCSLIECVYVSTDDEEISIIAQDAGALVPFKRPAHLATSGAAKHPVILHCVEQLVNSGLTIDRIIDLDPTAPLRSVADIEACVDLLDEHTDAVFTVYEAEKNPYFNLVEVDPSGLAYLSKNAGYPVVCRQQAPQVYAINGSVYAWHYRTLTKGMWNGKSRVHIMPRERSIDIDTLVDFKIAELFFSRVFQETEA